jgi:hypothetical protein
MDEPGVQVAWGYHWDNPTPTFVRIDNPAVASRRLVRGWTVSRGRQYLTDRTEAGQASVEFMDKFGALDPTNTTGPFYPMNPNCPIRISIFNPVTMNWRTVFAGLVQGVPQTMRYSGAPVSNGHINASDLFSMLALKEVPPGISFGAYNSGSNTIASSPNTDGSTTYAQQNVQDRIKGILADAGVPPGQPPVGMTNIFSGNVVCQQKVYSAGYTILSALQDAADAEWPGVANLYVDKQGTITFHGRLARFDSGEDNAYGIHTWLAGDDAAVQSNSSYASLATLDVDKDVDKVYNNALFAPENIMQSRLKFQLAVDSGSATNYGPRQISGLDLGTFGGTIANIGDGATETRQFSNYYVGNFAAATVRPSQAVFRPRNPSEPNAASHWNLMCNVEIGDRLQVKTTHPGGGGFNNTLYFVEGINYDVNLDLAGGIPDVTLALDLSSVEYFTSEPWVHPH